MQLERYTASALAQATGWAHLPPDELRRRSAVAASTRDADELWNLTRAHLFLHGAKGARVAEGTLRQYRTGVRALVEAWQGENLLRPSRDAGALYARQLEQTLAPSTVGLRLAAARALYRALRWSGATEASPFDGVTAAADPTPAHEKRGYYRTHEVEQLLGQADAAEVVIVLLGAHAGLRISEMAALKWSDVQGMAHVNGARSIRVLGKGGKLARVNLSERLGAALERLRLEPEQSHRRRSPDLVLPWSANRIRERFRDLCERAGVAYSERAFHGLRHSAATRLYQQTKDLGRVASHVRHSNINTTRRYAKLADEELQRDLNDW